MALLYNGSLKKSGGVISAISKNRKLINLKPVKRIVFKFDPFDETCVTLRKFMWHFNVRKVLKTNPLCFVKTEIVCDRSDPVIDVSLSSGESILFKTRQLNELELFQLFNKHITSLVPNEEEKPVEMKTKTAAAGTKKGKKK